MGRLDFGQLQWAVVDEDDAVGADVPRPEKFRDGFRLRPPVRFHGEEAVPSQKQVRPPQRFSTRAGSFLLATATRTPESASALKHLLIEGVGVAVAVEAPGDAVGAGLAEQAAPEGVVQVGDEALFGAVGRSSAASISATAEAWAVR